MTSDEFVAQIATLRTEVDAALPGTGRAATTVAVELHNKLAKLKRQALEHGYDLTDVDDLNVRISAHFVTPRRKYT